MAGGEEQVPPRTDVTSAAEEGLGSGDGTGRDSLSCYPSGVEMGFSCSRRPGVRPGLLPLPPCDLPGLVRDRVYFGVVHLRVSLRMRCWSPGPRV